MREIIENIAKKFQKFMTYYTTIKYGKLLEILLLS